MALLGSVVIAGWSSRVQVEACRSSALGELVEGGVDENCYPFGSSADQLLKRHEILDLRGFIKTVKRTCVD